MDTWLILHLPDGQAHTWDLGEVDPAEVEPRIWAARALVGFQPDDAWVTSIDPASIMVTFGRPHDDLMVRVVEHDAAELENAPVEDYRAEYEAATRQANVDRVHAALNGMDPDLLAAVLAERAR